MSEKADELNSLILQTPPGEYHEVINDLKSLVNEKTLSENCISSIIKLNNESFIDVKSQDGKPNSLITKYGQDENNPTIYYDHGNKLIINFNHYKCKKESVKPYTIQISNENLRLLIEKELVAYMKEFYETYNYAVYGFENKKRSIVICTENHIFKPKNFWNGQILSSYKIDESTNQIQIKGKLQTKDGNVQMFSKKKVQGTFQNDTPEKNALEIIKFIKTEESNYQTIQLGQLSDMMESTFKALRRQLPITRTKVDWSKISAYNIGKELSEK